MIDFRKDGEEKSTEKNGDKCSKFPLPLGDYFVDFLLLQVIRVYSENF